MVEAGLASPSLPDYTDVRLSFTRRSPSGYPTITQRGVVDRLCKALRAPAVG